MIYIIMVIVLLTGHVSYAAHKSDNDVNKGKKQLQSLVPLKPSDKEPVHATEWEKSEKELQDFKKAHLSEYVDLVSRVREAKNSPVIFNTHATEELLKKLGKYDTALKYAISDEELKKLKKKYHEISLKEKKEKYKKGRQLSYAWKLRLQVEIAREEHEGCEFANQANDSGQAPAKACAAKK